MSKGNARGKRIRRQQKQLLKFGVGAKPTHKAKHGRTGHSMRSRNSEKSIRH